MRTQSVVPVIIILFLLGCSSHNAPISPDSTAAKSQAQAYPGDGSKILGTWNIRIDGNRQSISLNPSRNSGTQLNLTGFSRERCDDCLVINNIQVINDSEFSFDAIIKHPFPDNPLFTVFDVRGILISESNFTFPDSNVSMPFGSDSVQLVNADGYMSSDNSEHSIYPYKAFKPENQRCVFNVTDRDTRTFHIKAPPDQIELDFALVAYWARPDAEEIVDPLVDFPPEANCPEAYRIDVHLDTWPALNETTGIRVQVYDHQGENTIKFVTCECPGLFDGTVILEKDTSCGCNIPVYEGLLKNTFGGEDGQAPMLITIRGTSTGASEGEVSAYKLIRSIADANLPDDSSQAASSQTSSSFNAAQLLTGYESEPGKFRESRFGKLIVLWRQQTIGNAEHTAVVEHAQKVYQFDSLTGTLIKQIDTWRDDLPKTLPKVIPQAQAESHVSGKILSVDMYYMSKNSDVFPIGFTINPFYAIKTDNFDVILVDAITGNLLGDGLPSPGSGYAFSGPQYNNPCSGTWTSWYMNAETRFENLGYPTSTDQWPDKSIFQTYVQNDDVNLIYEFGHGGSTYFYNGCIGGTGYQATYSSDVSSWIASYNKKYFAFLGHCDGMCSTGSGTLSYAHRKGSTENTATVGYCGMSSTACATCWTYSINWQDAFLGYLEDTNLWTKYTVFDAFQQANADYPVCGDYNCMRFAGDPEYTLDVNYGPGHLCEECEDCASAYCEGSFNYPARCGLSEPLEDCWVGGGDIPGCGDDPSSEYYDYYFDASGILQHEITSVYDCDILDICDGPEKTDYFVIENTNTCDSKSWIQSVDGWYGGGDNPGCGEDPISEYRVFYIDEFGQEQYYVTETFSCDESDDCKPPEITDYFVMENSNTCDSISWLEEDPESPILDSPDDGIQFKLGTDLHFKWHNAPGTVPKGYWLRIYHDSEVYGENGSDPVYGFYFSKATSLDLPSKVVEIVAADGSWEWEVGAYFGSDKYSDIHWSIRRSLSKQTAGVLHMPNDGIIVSMGELFEWESVAGAKNYVAKITGILPGGIEYYLPLNSVKTSFVLIKPYYNSLKNGEYTWAIAGTTYFTDDQKLLGSLSYSEPSRTFYK